MQIVKKRMEKITPYALQSLVLLSPDQLADLLNFVTGRPVVLGKVTVKPAIDALRVGLWNWRERKQAQAWGEHQLRAAGVLPPVAGRPSHAGWIPQLPAAAKRFYGGLVA